MSLEVKAKELETLLLSTWEIYLQHHRDLQKYAGKQLSSFTPEEIEDCNRILADIQTTFRDLGPIFNMFVGRSEWAKIALQEYNNFIEDIKKNGGKENDPSTNGITPQLQDVVN